MKKILIIGGGGYIGSAITPFLKKKKYDITIIDNFIYNHKKFFKKVLKKNPISLIEKDMQYIKPPVKKYDYVIAGGGSAGCVLANRLSKDPNI